MSGAPVGNQNAAKGNRWANAVERAVDAFPDPPVSLEVNKGIDKAAFEFVAKMMLEKDLGFFREFGDRIDGKPKQTLGGDPDNPFKHEITELTIRAIDATPDRPSQEGQ